MIGDIATYLVVEVVFETLVKGPGLFIARLVKPSVKPRDALPVFVGFAFWAGIAMLGYVAYLGSAA